MAEKTLIPVLRFSDFKNNWRTNTLGSIATFSKGKGISKADINNDGELACIRYGELYTRYGEIIDEVVSRTNVNGSGLVLSEANDVIIPASGETQIDIATASCVLHSGIALGGDLNIIKAHGSGVFLAYYLNNARKKDIAGLAQGISVVHLYANQLKTLTINLPQLEEQQKIASFLAAVDQRIQLLQKKKAKLEEYKKGLMQMLFSQEIRFRDENGHGFPDWEEKRLGEIFEISAGGDIAKDHFSLKKNKIFKYPIYANSEKKNGLFGYSDIFKVEERCITVSGRGSLGTANARFEKFYPIVRLLILKPKVNLNLIFFEHSINELKIYNESTGVPQLTSPQLKTYKVKYPKEKVEQDKIASFLSSLDQKIEQVEKQTDKMQIWKKGLLQKMFV